jgi:endo-1,4-beta-xylanase
MTRPRSACLPPPTAFTDGRASPSRRAVMAGLMALPASALAAAPEEEGLATRAARRGLTFGMAVSHEIVAAAEMQRVLRRDARMLTPENAMKWRAVEAVRGQRNFQPADAIVGFGRAHGMTLRGHTALWHQAIPHWALAGTPPVESCRLALDYAGAVLRRYRGRIAEWDVVNEAINPQDGLAHGMRNSVLTSAGGDALLADAFKLAREADPAALLFYNDYGVEYDAPDIEARRRAILALVGRLKALGAPIDGIGIQAHLKVGNRFNAAVWGGFLREIEQMGLRISITELDVDDLRLPSAIPERDQAVADHARRFLDVTLANRAVRTLVTWGVSDRHFWLSSPSRRADKLPARGLPLDADLQRKPLWHAIAAALDAAPSR